MIVIITANRSSAVGGGAAANNSSNNNNNNRVTYGSISKKDISMSSTVASSERLQASWQHIEPLLSSVCSNVSVFMCT